MTTFDELNLSAPLLSALADAGHHRPTPIQTQAIPHILNRRDLVGIAQTGTGKTAAFALPIIQHLDAGRRPAPKTCRVLVLSPTRELSGQIVETFRRFGRHIGLKVELVIGGVPMGRQIRALAQGVDVLVATPGRLIDLVEQRAVSLGAVEVLVLDEADQMLDMGFIHAIRAIVAKLPAERQTLLFSATMPAAITDLSQRFLHDPVRVSVAPAATTVDKVAQTVIHVSRADKPGRLAAVLADPAIDRALVFTRTKHGADKVVRALARSGIASSAIHGNKSQSQRERTLAAFRSGGVRALIATDIAARGLDIPGVSHVVNYDLPNVPESYVHRIGRTARAGASGIAVSLCDIEERPYLRDIERLIRMAIPVDGGAAPVSDPAPSAGAPARAPQDKRAQEGRSQGKRHEAKRHQVNRSAGSRSRRRRGAADAGPDTRSAARRGPEVQATGAGSDLASMPFLRHGIGDRRAGARPVES